ncbi:MAG: DegT/DnrJ/EryC1/StrS family aminotransferase [Nanoarchaeota archaeon]|nr:DegT/DnrJ/EryC1/StrS family aminotransferase [Nanoarchaeota archaeon]
MEKTSGVKISGTSIVKDSVIGEGSQVWEFANVYGTKIGKNTKIGSYVEVQNNTKIGDNVIISSHSFICSLVTIEDNVFIGHGVMTINDLHPPSKRRTGSDKEWKSTVIKRNAVIGSNATLMPVTIGENSIVGAGAVVTKDVPDDCVVAGNPAKIIRHLPKAQKEAGAMKIPLADLRLQHSKIRDELDLAIKKTVDDCSFIMSEQIGHFEKDFAAYCQVKHAIGVSNGTSAISLALEACGVKGGDEVITAPHTFIATTEAISKVGAKIKFVDIEEKTQLLDVTKIDSAITENTKAILAVHLNGLMCDMESIRKIADKHHLKVIEDAAQAHGALYNNNPPGFYSDAATFSFFPGKNLGAFGDAGAVITNHDPIAEKILMLRNHGRKPGEKYIHELEGYNERLDSLQAAVLTVKLKHLQGWNQQRIENARLYHRYLSSSGIILPHVPENHKHVYHQYVIRVKNREKLINFLKENGISSGINYPTPLHLQPAYASLGYKEGDFPMVEKITKEIVSLPMYPEMTEEQIRYVAEKVNECLSKENEQMP